MSLSHNESWGLGTCRVMSQMREISECVQDRNNHDANLPRENLATARKSHYANSPHMSPTVTPTRRARALLRRHPTMMPHKSPATAPTRCHCSLPIVVLASYMYLFICNYILLCINVANGVTVI